MKSKKDNSPDTNRREDSPEDLAGKLRLCQGQLRRKEAELEELEAGLEKRVGQEVAKTRELEHWLIFRHRQAAMEELIGNIAHQWRQPLTSVSLLFQDLGECYDYGEFTREYLDKAIHNAMNVIQHISRNIDDFRGIFRQETEPIPFKVSEVIRGSLSFLEPSLRYANVDVVLDLDEDHVVSGFPNELSQVLLNIIGNARNIFQERDTQDPRLAIHAGKNDGKTVITVTDNGGGIREKILERIFEPCFTERKNGKRCGLGLYLSRTIIENSLGGKLSAENTDGGARFVIEL